MPGPRPTPTALKMAAGNPGRRRLNNREPDPRIITRLPAPPPELSERAKRVWRDYGRELINAGLLTVLGLGCLRRYAIAFDDYETARELVAKTGIMLVNKNGGGANLNPAYNAKSMAAKELHQCELEFGMTPAAATKVKVANPKQMDLFGELFESDAPSDYEMPDDSKLN